MEKHFPKPSVGRVRPLPSVLLFLALLLASCSNSASRPATTFSPSPYDIPPASLIAARSPSAMEALNRGLAAITPPGAALKDIYYEFDSIELPIEAQEVLKNNAGWLKANPSVRVEIEGHCDDIGSAEYNLALGAKRAQSAKDFLVSQGIAEERLVTISYGKEAPACFEPTEECRVQNRRARFVIFSELNAS